MSEIRVNVSGGYAVCIESGLLDEAGRRIAAVTGRCAAAVVSDDRVDALYGDRLRRALEDAGFPVVSFVFPHGEGSKTLDTYARLLHTLSVNRLTRGDVVVALGGGVTGDLAGFAAATYQRGMGLVQIPTTLLAAVDSSVGGKTAVDLPTGKNQVGCFYQPRLVLCDPETLRTLPREEYRAGCAEVIKYGLLGSAALFEELKTPVCEQYRHVIEACVRMKRDLVCEDEFDTGRRRLLNLGHTVGHAVEACSGFTVSHGEAVAIGMAVITRAAATRGVCPPETLDDLLAMLRRYGLPERTDYPAEQLYEAALSDKKLAGGTLHLVVPEAVGRCRIEAVPVAEVRDWLRDGGLL